MRQSDPAKESGIERQLEHYRRDPLYRFTESEARELADEVLRLRDEATLGKTPNYCLDPECGTISCGTGYTVCPGCGGALEYRP